MGAIMYKALLVGTVMAAVISSLAAAQSGPRQTAQAVTLQGTVVCAIRNVNRCEAGECPNRPPQSAFFSVDFEQNIACLGRRGNMCQERYRFEVVTRRPNGVLLLFRRTAMLFLLFTNGLMQGADLNASNVAVLNGRCRSR